MKLTKGGSMVDGIYQDLQALQQSRIPNGRRVELVTGDRFETGATDLGEGILLSSGNFANPVNTSQVNTNTADIAQNALDIPATMAAHTGSSNPHPQYLTPDDLPSVLVSWFTDEQNILDPAYLQLEQDEPTTPESTVVRSTNQVGIPVELGQWMRKETFDVAFEWFETSFAYNLEMEANTANTSMYVESYRLRGGVESPIFTTGRTPLKQGTFAYNISVNLAGTAQIEVGDNIIHRIFIVKDEGTGTDTVSIHMEGSNTSRVVTNVPIPTYPAPHAETHEVGGSDLINHDNLTGAAGYNSHATIDVELAKKLESGDNISELVNDAGYITESGASALDDLTDVEAPNPAETDVLQYIDGVWKNSTFDATGNVVSVFGRQGIVVAEAGDYALHYATAQQGIKADTAVQPNDNVSDLTNDANYVSESDNVSLLVNDAGYITTAAIDGKADTTGDTFTGRVIVSQGSTSSIRVMSPTSGDYSGYAWADSNGVDRWLLYNPPSTNDLALQGRLADGQYQWTAFTVDNLSGIVNFTEGKPMYKGSPLLISSDVSSYEVNRNSSFGFAVSYSSGFTPNGGVYASDGLGGGYPRLDGGSYYGGVLTVKESKDRQFQLWVDDDGILGRRGHSSLSNTDGGGVGWSDTFRVYTDMYPPALDDLTGTVDNSNHLEGLDSSQFLRSDIFDKKSNGNLMLSNNVQLQIGDGAEGELFSNGINCYLDLNTDANFFIREGDNGNFPRFSFDVSGGNLELTGVLDAGGTIKESGQRLDERYIGLSNSLTKTSGSIHVNDSVPIILGTGGDAEFFASGINTYLDLNNDGDFIIRQGNNGNLPRFTFDSSSGNLTLTGILDAGGTIKESGQRLDERYLGISTTAADIGAISTTEDSVVYSTTRWVDDEQVRLGTGSDLRLSHTGTNSYIDNYTGNLYFRSLNNLGDMHFEATNGAGVRYSALSVAATDANVYAQLRHNGNTKLSTASDGVDITGILDVSSQIRENGTRVYSPNNAPSTSNVSGTIGGAIGLAGGVDLDTITTPGFYYQPNNSQAASGSNYPTPNAGSLAVYTAAGVVQVYRRYSTGASWTRAFYSGTWSPWYEHYTEGHKPTPAEIGAAPTSHTHMLKDSVVVAGSGKPWSAKEESDDSLRIGYYEGAWLADLRWGESIFQYKGKNVYHAGNLNLGEYLRSNAYDEKTSGSLRFKDSVKLELGTTPTSSILGNSTHTYWDSKVGNIYIRNASSTIGFTFEQNGTFTARGALKEWGTTLSNRYLGKTSTAADSSKLGGVSASSYLTSSSGTAYDSSRLGGYSASNFPRVGIDNTFSGNNYFYGSQTRPQNIYPRSSGSYICGSTNYRWSGVYGVVGDFTSTLFASSFAPFTGSHEGLITKTHAEIEQGDILVDTRLVHKPDISNAICEMALSSKANQRSARGVFVARKPVIYEEIVDDVNTYKPPRGLEGYEKLEELDVSFDQVNFNALGEGLINVCGQGGDIECGDLITTSDMIGKGMKQEDQDNLKPYTIAQSRESITFNSPDEVKQIAVIYKCG